MSCRWRVIAWSVVALFALPAAADQDPVVRAPAGTVKGIAEGAVNVFRGVPYAQPPVGVARWKPPPLQAPPPRW
jgi:para-nitrobenzyl esterase